MNKMFILGAGASRELKFISGTTDLASNQHTSRHHMVHGPLSNGFFYHATEFMKETTKMHPLSHVNGISDSLLGQMILEFYLKKNNVKTTMLDIINKESISKLLNIEELYVWVEDKLKKVEENTSSKEMPSISEIGYYFAKRALIDGKILT